MSHSTRPVIKFKENISLQAIFRKIIIYRLVIALCIYFKRPLGAFQIHSPIANNCIAQRKELLLMANSKIRNTGSVHILTMAPAVICGIACTRDIKTNRCCSSFRGWWPYLAIGNHSFRKLCHHSVSVRRQTYTVPCRSNMVNCPIHPIVGIP